MKRYVREWLGKPGRQRATFNTMPQNGKWSMTPEQALCLADPNGPRRCCPARTNIVEATFSCARDGTIEKLQKRQRHGMGAKHHPCLFPRHRTILSRRFNNAKFGEHRGLPALDGVVGQAQSAERAFADVGCGHGASTVLMAKTYPKINVL